MIFSADFPWSVGVDSPSSRTRTVAVSLDAANPFLWRGTFRFPAPAAADAGSAGVGRRGVSVSGESARNRHGPAQPGRIPRGECAREDSNLRPTA
jgi:hypothetical protein